MRAILSIFNVFSEILLFMRYKENERTEQTAFRRWIDHIKRNSGTKYSKEQSRYKLEKLHLDYST